MRKRIAGIGVVVGLALTMLPLIGAATAAEVCPEDGKVESVTDGDLDDIVLDAGVVVCIKGSTVLVTVTADGETSLRDLLGIDKNVSHFTVIEQVTTTTTEPEETTSTEQETTTTTAPEETTTTLPEETPTTIPKTHLPCVVDCGPPDSIPEVVPDPTPPATTPPELPFTGPSDWLIPLGWASLGMLIVGSWAAWKFRDRLS